MTPAGKRLRAALLAWFDRNRRELPWRRTRDPYAIWLSEVMLQQTQVATVIPYWERFLARFPTVTALAEAPLDEVLSLWSGLGYYSRARNLHRAANEVVARHGGALPASHAALLALPGFGRYTAGAVASIAFGLPEPLVDGNVARVFSRACAIEGAPGDREREKKLWAEAARWVQGERPGDLNQALMELGATVCRPEAPLCLLCPLVSGCRAHREDRIAELPPVRVRPPRKRLEVVAGVWRRGEALLLGKRRAKGLFGGLWELPCVEACEDPAEALSQALGCEVQLAQALGEVKRTLTHRDLTVKLFEVCGYGQPAAGNAYEDLRWVAAEALPGLGMSTAMSKALAVAVQAERGARSLTGAGRGWAEAG
jgi:A/G-specific adenine glycosylase